MRGVLPVSYTHLDVYKRQTYTDGLKAVDMVLVQKLNDNNKYVIIARVVEASVSYTHLDVYKRQHDEYLAGLVKIRETKNYGRYK